MVMRRKLALLLAAFIFCSCAIGLNNASKQKVEDIQRQINELNNNFQSIQREIKTLNENLDGLKNAMLRLADVLESINMKLGMSLTIKRLLP
jgi:septal ring factor EnvC (AmiA/AmiB activator)